MFGCFNSLNRNLPRRNPSIHQFMQKTDTKRMNLVLLSNWLSLFLRRSINNRPYESVSDHLNTNYKRCHRVVAGRSNTTPLAVIALCSLAKRGSAVRNKSRMFSFHRLICGIPRIQASCISANCPQIGSLPFSLNVLLWENVDHKTVHLSQTVFRCRWYYRNFSM